MTAHPVPPGIYYGGQAVIEGVMIRGPRHMAVAVRHPSGQIVTHAEALSGLLTGRGRRVPLLRGVLVLIETLSLGMRSLSFSSRIAMQAENPDAPPAEFPRGVFWGSLVVSLAFILGVFFAGPIFLSNLLEFIGAGRALIVAAEGVLRLLLFVAYIALIGLVPDIKRVFQYHGAEHMAIHACEAGRTLSVHAVRAFPKEHTRCGTSFLLVVVAISLVSFFVFDLLVDRGLVVRVLSRIILVLPIAAASYEVLRLGARFNHLSVVRALFVPNIALQALTTRVPDDAQIEVAIAAFVAAQNADASAPPATV